MQYPETYKSDQQDDYFGTIVKDPYRWLEDDNSAETKEWVEMENEVTKNYLAEIPYRNKIKQQLHQIFDYPKYSAPVQEGHYFYFYKNEGLQNQAVLYRQKDLGSNPEVFLDPNRKSVDGTLSLSYPSFSKSFKYAAYLESQSGSDWQTARIMNVADKTLLEDTLHFLKFTGLSWWKDEGVYYGRYPEPNENTKLTNQNQHHSIYYHKIGTPQSEDILIYQEPEFPNRFLNLEVTEDGQFLVLTKSEGTSGIELWVKNVSPESHSDSFQLLIKGFETEGSVIDNLGNLILVHTNMGAPNFKVVLIDPLQPAKENWVTIIPERKEVLLGVGTAGGKLFLNYLKDASTRIIQTDADGNNETEISLPGIGTAGGFRGYKDAKEIFYTFSSYSYPATIFRYGIATGKSELYHKSEAKIESDKYETIQKFFTSKDGTKIPMFLTYKKGLQQDGQNAVLLYGYGGFNVPLTPSFSISNSFWLDQGGILAVVNLRGGSEYGESWHQAGMLYNKQNVFDDFIAAAEYLIEEKYTCSEKLAMNGGSNGGLLVGAVMTQCPELCRVAIPEVGVLDMLRYQYFTIGYAWATEYGRSENEKDFKYLYTYSPLHNIKNGISYPATLVLTADHDDRVVPAHSFKFAATLQEKNSGENPILIRIDTKDGHGAGKPLDKLIESATDYWSFIMFNLGMNYR